MGHGEHGSWALITGATGGIGREIATQLALQGWNLVVHGRDASKLMALAGRLGTQGANVRIVAADLASADGALDLVEKVDALGVRIDLLVNNAGFGYAEHLVASDLERQRALVQVNAVSLMELTHAFGARMAAFGSGAILNVASVAAVMPGPGMSTYFASKAFVLSLTEAVHEELAPYGVRVTALCPGPVRTGFWDAAGQDTTAKDAFMLTPEEVARIGLVALSRNRGVCAPGLVSKACYAFGRTAPGILSRKVANLFNKKG